MAEILLDSSKLNQVFGWIAVKVIEKDVQQMMPIPKPGEDPFRQAHARNILGNCAYVIGGIPFELLTKDYRPEEFTDSDNTAKIKYDDSQTKAIKNSGVIDFSK